jgi:hypothetical protein
LEALEPSGIATMAVTANHFEDFTPNHPASTLAARALSYFDSSGAENADVWRGCYGPVPWRRRARRFGNLTSRGGAVT